MPTPTLQHSTPKTGLEAHTPFDTLKRDVIDVGLCTRCGTCVGVCPSQHLEFVDVLGDCLPAAKATIDCVDCPAPCLAACPGAEVDFMEMNRQVFGTTPDDILLGHALDFYVSWANDDEIRARGSSGGAMTAILKYLLETGAVKGVVCLADDPDDPMLPKPIIATSYEMLRAAQQSKYSIAPVNQILREIEAFDGPVAFVGLPDQVQALRKLQQMDHPSVRNIKLILGSYCGSVHHFTSIVAFLKKHGITDLDAVARVEYRAGTWPGKLRVTLNDGRKFELEKFYANYMTLFYAVERSMLCIDLSNEFADLSFGDAWAPRYEDRHEGFSYVIARTKAGRDLITACSEQGIITVQPSTRSDGIEMHSHGLFNKKNAVWSRMTLRKWMGKPVPHYGYTVDRTLKQKGVGMLIAVVFAFGRTRLARWIVQQLPLDLTGAAFSFVRKKWRKATRPKRSKAIQHYTIRIADKT